MSGDQIWPILLGISVVLNLLLLLRRPILSWLHRDKGEELANEIMAMVEEGEESGAIEQNEKELIENIFEFNSMTADDVMIHRTDMGTLPLRADDSTILSTIQSSGLSRFPVYNEDIDDIVGILSTRDYLLNSRQKQPLPLEKLLRPAYFVPESVRADVLFRDMQSKKVHMAIVVDEYGGTSGLVTMEDLLETIVGDLDDEHEDDNAVVTLADGVYEVGGDVPVNELEGLLGEDIFENADCDTIGGFITETLGRIPQAGETLPLETLGYTLTVAEATPRAVTKVTITRTAEKTADPQPAPEQKRRFGRKKDRDGEKLTCPGTKAGANPGMDLSGRLNHKARCGDKAKES